MSGTPYELSVITLNGHLRSNDDREHPTTCLRLYWDRYGDLSERFTVKDESELTVSIFSPDIDDPDSFRLYKISETEKRMDTFLITENEKGWSVDTTQFAQLSWKSTQATRTIEVRVHAWSVGPEDQKDCFSIGSAILEATASPFVKSAPMWHGGTCVGEVFYQSNLCLPLMNVPTPLSVLEEVTVPSRKSHDPIRPHLVGHRGCGGHTAKTASELNEYPMENTILSFETALDRGVDLVELDVQMPSDGVPVILHDFFIDIEHNKIKNTIPSCLLKSTALTLPALPDADLSVALKKKLKGIWKSLPSPVKGARQSIRSSFQKLAKVPLYAQALMMTTPALGFNVEVKYPFFEEEHSLFGQPAYQDMNAYVDAILKDTFEYAGARNVFFSCFSPEICQLLRHKQSKYDVLFLVMEQKLTEISIFSAAMFACMIGLQGIVCECSWIESDPEIVAFVHHENKVIWTYGDKNNDMEFVQKQIALGVDKIITDTV